MKTVCMFFAARRYWADEEKLRSAYETLAAQMGEGIECCLVADAMEEDKLPQGDCLIAVSYTHLMCIRDSHPTALVVLADAAPAGSIPHR